MKSTPVMGESSIVLTFKGISCPISKKLVQKRTRIKTINPQNNKTVTSALPIEDSLVVALKILLLAESPMILLLSMRLSSEVVSLISLFVFVHNRWL